MGKSRKNRKSIMVTIRNTGKKALPVVSSGLKTVGSTAKNVAMKTAPVVEKGVSVVYGTFAKGLELGVTGAKNAFDKVEHTSKKHGGKTRKMNKTQKMKSIHNNTKNSQYKKYKWVSNGTCSSHKYKNLTRKDCTKYFPKSNYIVTDSPHGPPGCWLVLGDHLKGAIKDDKSLKGKGFACWTKKKDGKCSPGFPCVCK